MERPDQQGSASDGIARLQQALEELTAAIETNPSDAEAYYRRGVAYGQLVEPLAAIRDFNQVIRFDPGNSEAYYNRGLSYIHLREHLAAVEDFTETIRLTPSHVDAYTTAPPLCTTWVGLNMPFRMQTRPSSLTIDSPPRTP